RRINDLGRKTIAVGVGIVTQNAVIEGQKIESRVLVRRERIASGKRPVVDGDRNRGVSAVHVTVGSGVVGKTIGPMEIPRWRINEVAIPPQNDHSVLRMVIWDELTVLVIQIQHIGTEVAILRGVIR